MDMPAFFCQSDYLPSVRKTAPAHSPEWMANRQERCVDDRSAGRYLALKISASDALGLGPNRPVLPALRLLDSRGDQGWKTITGDNPQRKHRPPAESARHQRCSFNAAARKKNRSNIQSADNPHPFFVDLLARLPPHKCRRAPTLPQLPISGEQGGNNASCQTFHSQRPPRPVKIAIK